MPSKQVFVDAFRKQLTWKGWQQGISPREQPRSLPSPAPSHPGWPLPFCPYVLHSHQQDGGHVCQLPISISAWMSHGHLQCNTAKMEPWHNPHPSHQDPVLPQSSLSPWGTRPFIQLLRPKLSLVTQDSAPILTSSPSASAGFPVRAHPDHYTSHLPATTLVQAALSSACDNCHGPLPAFNLAALCSMLLRAAFKKYLQTR